MRHRIVSTAATAALARTLTPILADRDLREVAVALDGSDAVLLRMAYRVRVPRNGAQGPENRIRRTATPLSLTR